MGCITHPSSIAGKATRFAIVAVIASLSCALGASAARASTVSVSGATVDFVGAPGESNGLEVSMVGGGNTTRVYDRQVPLTAGLGCNQVDANTADCPGPPDAIHADLGDVGDSAYFGDELDPAAVSVPVTVLGGPGNDNLSGGHGDDTLDGGDGHDWFWSSAGADTFIGGDGNDVVDYHSYTVRLKIDIRKLHTDGYYHGGRAADGGFNDRYDAGLEVFLGGSGNDKMLGNQHDNSFLGGPGNDLLRGYAGNDGLDGGSGRDNMDGGTGDDTLQADDFVKENVRCGAGNDHYQVDSLDIARGCEVLVP